ncbi:unnamed protein product [marine sediment metagenome]|uniref:Uncharacterized protein n=1 Tax=marine sediment metagenome TaxID=412755 RepID=X1Q672_9ZZZZ
MSDELTKLRASIKKSKAVIEAAKTVLVFEGEEHELTAQTEKGEHDQTEEPPRSE